MEDSEKRLYDTLEKLEISDYKVQRSLPIGGKIALLTRRNCGRYLN